MGFWSDLGDAASSAVSAVGDAVEGAVDAVADTVEDVVDTVVDGVQDGLQWAGDQVCGLGSVACGVGNVLLGGIDGLLQGAQDLLHDGFDIVRDIGGLVGSLLSLDLPRFLKVLGTLVIDVLDLVVDGVRFVLGGYVVGGVVRYFKRSMLREFVDNLVNEKFSDDPERLALIRSNTGLDGGTFGFRLPSIHRVFVMDSATVPLWQMHEAGTIDLYALAGLNSFDSFSLGAAHPNAMVRSVGADGSDNWWPVTRWTISKYLESRGAERRLRVYAMSDRTIAQMLDTTSRKLEEIGVVLEWNDGGNFSVFRDYASQEIGETEYDFNTGQLETILARPEFERPAGVNCELLALAAFKLERLGRVAARDIDECEAFPEDCSQQGRTDRCCMQIERRRSSGVIYRDSYPTDVFQYVLAHEVGHYVGLCHCGHDGFQNIMYTKADVVGLSFFDWGLFSYYWESEPHFSLDDGKNTWRFLVDQMVTCLAGEAEGGDVDLTAPLSKNRPESCATPHEIVGALEGAGAKGRSSNIR